MEFTATSILMALFTGVVAGISSYFASYGKVKAEVRAATEDLRQTIEILRETTRAAEVEKARIMVEATLASDLRKSVYALASASQSLVHSMCWISWDARARHVVRADLSRMYDAEVHKLMPEIFGQMAVIRLLDSNLHARAYSFVEKLTRLDVDFGNAIVLSETDVAAATERLKELHEFALELGEDAERVFGTEVAIPRTGTHVFQP